MTRVEHVSIRWVRQWDTLADDLYVILAAAVVILWIGVLTR